MSKVNDPFLIYYGTCLLYTCAVYMHLKATDNCIHNYVMFMTSYYDIHNRFNALVNSQLICSYNIDGHISIIITDLKILFQCLFTLSYDLQQKQLDFRRIVYILADVL